MRLDEILSSNQIIISLRNMRIKFVDDFNFIKSSHEFFLKANVGPTRHRILLGNIDILKTEITPFLNYDFDPDPDIDQLKIEARNILRELARLETEIL
jgi:hypothetical protein